MLSLLALCGARYDREPQHRQLSSVASHFQRDDASWQLVQLLHIASYRAASTSTAQGLTLACGSAILRLPATTGSQNRTGRSSEPLAPALSHSLRHHFPGSPHSRPPYQGCRIQYGSANALLRLALLAASPERHVMSPWSFRREDGECKPHPIRFIRQVTVMALSPSLPVGGVRLLPRRTQQYPPLFREADVMPASAG
jgi:hypothetical protein